MRPQTGFTLLELIVTLVMSVILLGVGVPSLQEMVRSAQRKQISNGLYLALNKARYEAITRNTDVVMASADGGWNNGWVVFADLNGNLRHDPPAEEALLEVEPQSEQFPILTRPAAQTVRFSRAGRPAATVQFILCGRDAQDSRRVDTGLSGRVTLYDLRSAASVFTSSCPQ